MNIDNALPCYGIETIYAPTENPRIYVKKARYGMNNTIVYVQDGEVREAVIGGLLTLQEVEARMDSDPSKPYLWVDKESVFHEYHRGKWNRKILILPLAE